MNHRANRIAKAYKAVKGTKSPPSQSKYQVMTLPPLGSKEDATTSTASVTGIVQLQGRVPDESMNGVSLANTQEVVTLDSTNKVRWGVVSQTMPNTVLEPQFNLGRPVTAQQWVTATQPGTQSLVITSHHPNEDATELLKRHELGGVMADQIVTLAAQQPVHYVSNELVLDSGKGAAVSRYEYSVSDGVVPWRIFVTQCWLRRVTSEGAS